MLAGDLWHYARISFKCDRQMVQRNCDNSLTEADGIKVATPPVSANSFSSGRIQVPSAETPGNKRNTVLIYVR
jgi:hypothetical protein